MKDNQNDKQAHAEKVILLTEGEKYHYEVGYSSVTFIKLTTKKLEELTKLYWKNR
jgi:hypothetical protein